MTEEISDYGESRLAKVINSDWIIPVGVVASTAGIMAFHHERENATIAQAAGEIKEFAANNNLIGPTPSDTYYAFQSFVGDNAGVAAEFLSMDFAGIVHAPVDSVTPKNVQSFVQGLPELISSNMPTLVTDQLSALKEGVSKVMDNNANLFNAVSSFFQETMNTVGTHAASLAKKMGIDVPALVDTLSSPVQFDSMAGIAAGVASGALLYGKHKYDAHKKAKEKPESKLPPGETLTNTLERFRLRVAAVDTDNNSGKGPMQKMM